MPAFKNILLVDDSEIDVLVNRRLIELTSFASNIITTVSGEEALKFLQEECRNSESAPEWIFLDMFLPGMNGFEFIEEFKKLPDFIVQKSKIVVLSVFQKQEEVNKILEYKFVAGQIEKPLTQQTLQFLAENRKININASF